MIIDDYIFCSAAQESEMDIGLIIDGQTLAHALSSSSTMAKRLVSPLPDLLCDGEKHSLVSINFTTLNILSQENEFGGWKKRRGRYQ